MNYLHLETKKKYSLNFFGGRENSRRGKTVIFLLINNYYRFSSSAPVILSIFRRLFFCFSPRFCTPDRIAPSSVFTAHFTPASASGRRKTPIPISPVVAAAATSSLCPHQKIQGGDRKSHLETFLTSASRQNAFPKTAFLLFVHSVFEPLFSLCVSSRVFGWVGGPSSLPLGRRGRRREIP